MSSWMNDTAVQNHNGAGFNHLDPNVGGAMLDPSAFMNNNAAPFDPSHFPNPQLQQRMQNGGLRNGSPAFNNPQYQTNSLIPSKRPRPREDSLGGASPRQTPGMIPNSRSQTPQQNPYPGFPQGNPSQPHAPQQTPYSHLQNGSGNASPSPVMSNQMRPGAVPQRVATASPHPFSPAAQQFPQPSPSQSEHGSRVDTPQNSNPYAQNPQFAPGFNHNFTPPPGGRSSAAPSQTGMSTPHLQQAQMQQGQMFQQAQQHPNQQRPPQNPNDQQRMMYQIQLQQQLQQRNLMAAQRGNIPPNANPTNPQMPNGQMAGPRPQQVVGAGQVRGAPNPEQFMKGLVTFMQSKKLPLNMNPIVGDRQIALASLYYSVMKFGGYRKVHTANMWSQVAQSLQFHPMQHPNAAQQLREVYERNLLHFEQAWHEQRQRQAMMQQNPNMPAGQMSPTKQMHPQAAMQQQAQNFMQQQQQQQQQHLLGQQQHLQPHLQPQQAHATPVKQMTPMHHAQQPSINGFSTPQAQQPHPAGPQSHSRNSLSRTIDATPPQNGPPFTSPSPMSGTKPGGISLPSPQVDARASAPPPPQEFNLPPELDPKVRILDTWGGVELDSLLRLGGTLMQFKPDVPAVADLGMIDIHALTMSLQSGLFAEVRLALDTLVSLSVEPRVQLDLRACEDLVETLIDCAEVQVEQLAEDAAEVSDVMLVNSYEDVVRGCRAEQELLQAIPEFGSYEYDLDRAVDRLICITTILRNLSFYETNHPLLADDLVIKFLCVVIRYLGTRNMLLRTNANTLDFMKDVIIFLSNLSQAIELPGREQALCLLHFLLAFAPCPTPHTVGAGIVSFSPYDPAIHRYLPPAVDSLAKLLARDEPNRTHYKTIFASDVASTPTYDLLARTFALAISPVPDDKQEVKRTNMASSVVEARKPFLMQGMLAAEILANLAPGYDTGVAKSWLVSEDGFSQKLCRLILQICLDTTTHPQHSRTPAVLKGVEDEALLHITLGGIAVLRKLAEKSRDPDDPASTVPPYAMPTKENVLAALKIEQAQGQHREQHRLPEVLKQICAYASLST